MNPYVDKCHVSVYIIKASNSDKEVILIKRPPDDQRNSYRDRKKEYHQILLDSGIKLTYNKSVHAKLLVLDRAVAIVSSMNLYSASTAGVSWEAGIVSIEATVVESITNSILGLLENPESIKAFN